MVCCKLPLLCPIVPRVYHIFDMKNTCSVAVDGSGMFDVQVTAETANAGEANDTDRDAHKLLLW